MWELSFSTTSSSKKCKLKKRKLSQTFFQRPGKQAAFILSACTAVHLQPTGNQVCEGHILESFFCGHLMVCSSHFSMLVLEIIRNVLLYKLWLQLYRDMCDMLNLTPSKSHWLQWDYSYRQNSSPAIKNKHGWAVHSGSLIITIVSHRYLYIC